MSEVVVGQAVPAFTAISTQGELSPESLHGRSVVLYFYPKDNTPGCTSQAQGFRDLYQDFIDAGCQIVGISRDSLKSHVNFTEKQKLPFPLVSDPDETLCQLFKVMKLKNMYGKQVRGIERSTFLLNKQGVLTREWRGLRVAGHVDEVLQAAKELV
jgi:peroxiredoxin Q/BCP